MQMKNNENNEQKSSFDHERYFLEVGLGARFESFKHKHSSKREGQRILNDGSRELNTASTKFL